MEQLVRVLQADPGGTARVMYIRESACSGDCHKCSGCGAAKESVVVTADNPIGAGPGDLVRMESETGPVLRAAAVLYIVPLILFFLGYALGARWALGGLGGGVGFALGIAVAVLYDRTVMRAQAPHYHITSFARRVGREEGAAQ